MTNPLLTQGRLPTFSTILPEHVEPAVRQVLTENRAELQRILANPGPFTWDNLMTPLAVMNDKLTRVWSPVSHLRAVAETAPLREAYNVCRPLLTEYGTEIMQNEKLYRAMKSLADSAEYDNLDYAQRKTIENELRDFHLSGVDLSEKDKAQFGDLQMQLSKHMTKFSENILDATQGWTLHLTKKADLAGLPDYAVQTALETAQEKKMRGWILTLEYPSYVAAIKYLDNRALRKQIYEAFVTRASEMGPNAKKWDNSAIMEDILRIRHAQANLLGFANYAAYSLAPKMAHDPATVMTFLQDLVTRSKAAGEQEMATLRQFAKDHFDIDALEAWDLSYYSEKLRQEKYAIAQETLRPYFPVDKVIDGMFTVVNSLYGMRITERFDVDTWHEHVKFFEIYDELNELRGCFYADLYARPNKRDGAWMDECRARWRLPDGSVQCPVAFLTCNFNRPTADSPSLLSQDDVLTLFHEFGHCLQHLLTKIDYLYVSGISGVPWDAVEFPSQFMENWCWDRESINLISGHYRTHEPLPDDLFNKMLATKNFEAAMQMLRQLEFALFDFRLHLEYDPKQGGRIQALIDDVRKQVSVVKVPSFNRFQHSFSHIFAGEYSAGYYSYKWAEVLSSDAFSKFEEKGLFDRTTGEEFLECILEQGGAREPMELFVAFRGREPKIDALLRHSGLTN